MLRNFIDIIGLTKEEQLPSKINGQIIEYSEVDYIDIPEDKPKVKDVYQIALKAEVKSKRTINAPTGKIVVIDGEKSLKIVYSQKGESEKANILNLNLPFNTFIDIEDNVQEIKKIDIHILDAYFEIISDRKLYSYILYMANVEYYNLMKKQLINIDESHSKNIKIDQNTKKNIKFVEVEEDNSVYVNKVNNAFEELSMSEIKENYDNTNYINNEQYKEQDLVDIDSEYL